MKENFFVNFVIFDTLTGQKVVKYRNVKWSEFEVLFDDIRRKIG